MHMQCPWSDCQPVSNTTNKSIAAVRHVLRTCRTPADISQWWEIQSDPVVGTLLLLFVYFSLTAEQAGYIQEAYMFRGHVTAASISTRLLLQRRSTAISRVERHLCTGWREKRYNILAYVPHSPVTPRLGMCACVCKHPVAGLSMYTPVRVSITPTSDTSRRCSSCCWCCCCQHLELMRLYKPSVTSSSA